MVHVLDKNGALEILETIQRCTAVDHSAPTLMCMYPRGRKLNVEEVWHRICSGACSSTIRQVYAFCQGCILRKIEEKRGVTLTDSGIPEVRPSFAAEGAISGQVNKTVSTAPTTLQSASTSYSRIFHVLTNIRSTTAVFMSSS